MASDTDKIVREHAMKAAEVNSVEEFMGIVLSACKSLPTEWHRMDEGLQDNVIQLADSRIRAAISDLISAIGGGGFTRIPATIEKINAGAKAISVGLMVSRENDSLHFQHTGSAATLVLVDTRAFVDAEHSYKPDANQPDLPLGQPGQVDAIAAAFAEMEAEDEGIDPADEADAADAARDDDGPTPGEVDQSFRKPTVGSRYAAAGKPPKVPAKKVPGRTPKRKGRG